MQNLFNFHFLVSQEKIELSKTSVNTLEKKKKKLKQLNPIFIIVIS